MTMHNSHFAEMFATDVYRIDKSLETAFQKNIRVIVELDAHDN